MIWGVWIGLTPEVDPELLQTCAAEAIDAQHTCSSTSEGDAHDETMLPRVLAEAERYSTSTHAANEDDPSSLTLDQSPFFQCEEPHAETESTQDTSKLVGDFFEYHGNCAYDAGRYKCSDEIRPLDGIADRGCHYVDD